MLPPLKYNAGGPNTREVQTMSLYGNFTIREWLALHCVTEDIVEHFRKALEDNDEPMTVLTLAELIKRGDIDLLTYAIQDATNAGHIAPGSHFATVFANALTRCGDRDPVLRLISKNVSKKGSWPQTAAELLDGTTFADCERLTSQQKMRGIDDRLSVFLKSFMRDGWFSLEFGFFVPGTEWDPHCKEHISTNIGESCNLIIRNGFILNREEIPDVLNVLDDVGIVDVLPTFNGEELKRYTLNTHGQWVTPEEVKKENFFYVSYYSLE